MTTNRMRLVIERFLHTLKREFFAVAWCSLWGLVSLLTICTLAGCGHAAPNLGIAGAAATVYLGQAPGQEIEQVYYLGVFDPREQLPPTVYRVTVRGQASAISNVKFGSGWVPASFIDSLNTQVGFDGTTDRPKITTGPSEPLSTLATGRRLMLFGPEGFREAPKDHRLVIVMGTNPDAYFRAIDNALGVITKVTVEQNNSSATDQLVKASSAIRAEQKRLSDLNADVAQDLPASSGGAQ